MSYPAAYVQMLSFQELAAERARDASNADTAKLMLAWEKLERLKREMRGIPPLKAIDSPKWPRRARAKLIDAGDAAIEIESKESISTPTVTAPPTPPAPKAT
jgi:hypothetical protein